MYIPLLCTSAQNKNQLSDWMELRLSRIHSVTNSLIIERQFGAHFSTHCTIVRRNRGNSHRGVGRLVSDIALRLSSSISQLDNQPDKTLVRRKVSSGRGTRPYVLTAWTEVTTNGQSAGHINQFQFESNRIESTRLDLPLNTLGNGVHLVVNSASAKQIISWINIMLRRCYISSVFKNKKLQ